MNATDTRPRVLKPSDVVVWHFPLSDHSWTRLRKLGTASRLVDTQDEQNRAGRFAARYRWSEDEARRLCRELPFVPDPLAPCWELVTQGLEVGGRRYRHGLTLAEAQDRALRWIDRRYRAVDAETGQPIELEAAR